MEIAMGDRGRLVLPKKVRQRLGLTARSRLELELGSNHLILKPKRSVRVRDIYGIAKLGRVRLADIKSALGDEAVREMDEIGREIHRR